MRGHFAVLCAATVISFVVGVQLDNLIAAAQTASPAPKQSVKPTLVDALKSIEELKTTVAAQQVELHKANMAFTGLRGNVEENTKTIGSLQADVSA